MNNQATNRIGLGAVQFGMDYGIANEAGKISPNEAAEILDYAYKHGIRLLDTAADYGDSESVIGGCLKKEHRFQIVSKIISCGEKRITADFIDKVSHGFYRSLENLKQKSIYGLLVHYGDDLLKPGGEHLMKALAGLKAEGLISKIGVSIYTGEQIETISEICSPDIVQLPLNIFDQRLIESGWLLRLKAIGIEIHARSIFLQGLLLMNPYHLDSFFDPLKEHIINLQESMRSLGITPLEAALDFALKQNEVDRIIIGVSSLEDLKQICGVLSSDSNCSVDYSQFAIDDDNFLNPSRWRVAAKSLESVGA